MPPSAATASPSYAAAAESPIRGAFLTQAGFDLYSSRFRSVRERVWSLTFLALMIFVVSGYTYIFVYLNLEQFRPMFLAAGGGLFYMFTSRFSQGMSIRWTHPQGRLLGFFLLVVLLTGVFSINRGYSFMEFQTFIKMFLLYILVTNAIQTPKQLHIFLMTLAFVSAVPAAAGLFGWVTGTGMREGYRAAWIGSFYDPNRLAGVIAMNVPCQLYAMKHSRLPFRQFIFGGFLLLGVVTVLLTGSRGGMIAFMGVGAIAISATRWKVPMIFMAGILGLALFFAAPSKISERWSADSVSTGSGRTLIWKNGLRIFLHRPIRGVGIGNFYWATENFYVAEMTALTRYRAPHNTWLQVLVDTGIFGFACFVGMFLTSLKDMRRISRKMNQRYLKYEGEADLESAEAAKWMSSVGHTLFLYLVGVLLAGLTVDYGYEWFLYLSVALAVVAKQLYMDSGFQAEDDLEQQEEVEAGEGIRTASSSETTGLQPAAPGRSGQAEAFASVRGRHSVHGRSSEGETPGRGKGEHLSRLDRRVQRLAAQTLAMQDAEMGRGPGGTGRAPAGRFTGLKFRGS
jgi:O-antigen ligase